MIGSIDIKTRPLKLAFLVDPNSQKQVREAIRLSSSLWGGSYFPIIQLYKGLPASWREKHSILPKAKDVVLGYIEAFDPDILVQLSKGIPQYISEIGIQIIKPNDIWCDISKNNHLRPKFGIGLFELLDDIFEHHFKFVAKYPLKIVFPKLPREYSLFWASFFGEVPTALAPHLKDHYYEPLEIIAPNFKINDLGKLMGQNFLSCKRITRHGTTRFGHSGFSRDAYVFFMDASKVEDVVDYWNLGAMGKPVLPMPKQFKNGTDLNDLVTGFLKAHRRHWSHNPKVCDFASILKSRNCTVEELQDFTKTIKIEPNPKDTSGDPYFSQSHWYPRIWDEWARDKDGAVPRDIYGEEEESFDIADAKELRISFRSVLPRFAEKYRYCGEPRCANEISFHFYGTNEYVSEVFPKYHGENFLRAISGFASFRGDWRVGRNGLVKLVKNSFNETQNIPISEKVIFAWLEDIGWKPELSPPGILAKRIYRLLDGRLAILRNENLLGLLEYMNGGSVKKNGSPSDVSAIHQERDLLVGDIKTRLLEGPGNRRNLHDYLIEKGLFRVGLRIQCPNCSRHSWHAIDGIGNSLVCTKCSDTFSAIGNIDGSKWSYKTMGPFSVPNYAEGAYTVLLTLDFFNEHKMSTIRITPVTSFKAEAPNKKNIEADFAAFWQDTKYGTKIDGLVFGECKTYRKFESADFTRMKYLAKTFPGAVLVFSTLRKELTPKEIKSIIPIVRKGRRYWKAERPVNPILILTGNELLSDFGPPFCWEDSVKKKHDRVTGLLDLCNVTQQIYLNLPSWQDEWHKKWEKERRRHLAKNGGVA